VRDELLGRPVKDQDFLVPGVGHAELRAALVPHGRVEDLVVAGRNVGVRFYPRTLRVSAGIELAPPRTERSTGPGRHDFEIVADPSVSIEDDMRRRDFTMNALARSLETGAIVDPLGGAEDLRAGILRVVGPTSFRDDGLRIARGLRFVSEHDLDPDDETRAQMRRWADRIGVVSGERLGAELAKLLLGAHPLKALRLARDTGTLEHLLPELVPAIGFDQTSDYHAFTLDEHLFRAVQAGVDDDVSLEVRLALLLHDSGKPESSWRGRDGRLHFYANPQFGKAAHEEIGARIARVATRRLRFPAETQARVERIVAAHMFGDHASSAAPLRARRFLARHGRERAFDLVAHKRADVRGKHEALRDRTAEELERLRAFEGALWAELEAGHATQVSELAVDGGDLIALGFREGPQLGRALQALLAEAIADPAHNTRAWLTGVAEQLLRKGDRS